MYHKFFLSIVQLMIGKKSHFTYARNIWSVWWYLSAARVAWIIFLVTLSWSASVQSGNTFSFVNRMFNIKLSLEADSLIVIQRITNNITWQWFTTSIKIKNKIVDRKSFVVFRSEVIRCICSNFSGKLFTMLSTTTTLLITNITSYLHCLASDTHYATQAVQ